MARKRFFLKIFITSLVILSIGFFIFFNSRLFIKGPQIEVFGPENGSSFEDPFIEITGKTENVSFISLNDNPIFIDESGNFREKLLLSPGVSIIELYAHDTFNREKTILLQYVYNGTEIERSKLEEEESIPNEEVVEENFIES